MYAAASPTIASTITPVMTNASGRSLRSTRASTSSPSATGGIRPTSTPVTVRATMAATPRQSGRTSPTTRRHGMGAGRGSLGSSVSLRSATHDPPPSWVSHAPRARRGRGAAAARLGHQGLKRLLPLLALVLLPIALLLLALLRHRTHPLPTFASPVATLGVRVSRDRMRWVRQTPNPRVELVMRSSTHRCLAPVIPPTSVRSHRCRGQGRRTRLLRAVRCLGV